MSYYGWRWPAYVSVAERKRKAAKKVQQLNKKRKKVEPVVIEGRTIAKTYWGKSWCKNLESYSDFANRIPRGRSYVRNGAVIDLKVSTGFVEALVCGNDVYKVTIDIATLAKKRWKVIVKACSGKIDSVIELLKGKFSKSVMEMIASRETGLFPHPGEIKISCTCPDYAEVCKHVAAVFYAIGARFDVNPELLFILRQVDHNELVVSGSALETLIERDVGREEKALASDDLSSIFGLDIVMDAPANKKQVAAGRKKVRTSVKKPAKPRKSKKDEITKRIKKNNRKTERGKKSIKQGPKKIGKVKKKSVKKRK